MDILDFSVMVGHGLQQELFTLVAVSHSVLGIRLMKWRYYVFKSGLLHMINNYCIGEFSKTVICSFRQFSVS